MPDYVVTGGPDGTAGVSLGSDHYAPGDRLTATARSVKWLVDGGYLTPAGSAPASDEEE